MRQLMHILRLWFVGGLLFCLQREAAAQAQAPEVGAGGAAGGLPSWLAGSVEMNFVVVALIAGAAVIGSLVYLTRRLTSSSQG